MFNQLVGYFTKTKSMTIRLLILSLLLSVSSITANAGNIPTCDERKVLVWLEKLYFDKLWGVPKDKFNLKLEFLNETFSQPNQRGCEVTFRVKLNVSGLKEMDNSLELWNKETGGSRPPSQLTDYYYEAVNKMNFIIKYDLISKDWYGEYQKGMTNQLVGKYRYILAGRLLTDIKKEKEIVAIAQARKEKSEIEAAERERLRAEKIEQQNRQNTLKKNSMNLIDTNQNFKECVQNKITNSLEYPSLSRRLEEQGKVIVQIAFIDGIASSSKIIDTPHRRLGEAVKKASNGVNCSESEKTTGTIEMSFNFLLR